jgi:hypothetical protein
VTPLKRFLIGGGGALMPVLVSFLAIDIGAALSNDADLSTANIIGIAIRYVILFLVGGVIGYLHEDEHKPFKLFELGIAAPALITSFITAQGVAAHPSTPSANHVDSSGMSLIGAAHASSRDESEQIILAGGFISDVYKGFSGSVYRDISKSLDKAHSESGNPIDKTVDDAGNTSNNANQDNVKAIEKSVVDSVKPNENTTSNNQGDNYQKIIKYRAEAAKLQAEAARARAEVLAKEYQAAITQAEAAEAEAHEAAKRVLLLEQPSL